MSETPKHTYDRLQTGIKLLSAYALGEKLVLSEKFLEECTHAIQVDDPLLKICFAARTVGINAAVQEVYSLRDYMDRDEVWIIEKGDRMLLIDTPVWKISFKVMDSMSGLKIMHRKHLSHFLDFSVAEIPYRALILDRHSLRKWAETSSRTMWSEKRRWFVKHSGWISLIAVSILYIYVLLIK